MRHHLFISEGMNVMYRAELVSWQKKVTKCVYLTHAKHLIHAENAKDITRRNIKTVTCKNTGRMREEMLQHCLPPH